MEVILAVIEVPLRALLDAPVAAVPVGFSGMGHGRQGEQDDHDQDGHDFHCRSVSDNAIGVNNAQNASFFLDIIGS